MEARFSVSVQTGAGAHPASYTNGTEFWAGLKQPERGVESPAPFSAEVKETVEIYS